MTIHHSIAIVGAGPWGLAVLDRIVTRARLHSELDLRIDIFDPQEPGTGIHSPHQGEFLLLNTMAGQIDSFSSTHFGGKTMRGALSFMDWIHRYHDARCSSNTFLPRKMFGEYLRFVFDVLRSSLPSNVSLTKHREIAADIRSIADARFAISLESGIEINFDYIFVCTGHGLDNHDANSNPNDALPVYPIAKLEHEIGGGNTVGLMGMGLVAVDAVSALTEGRGGRFCEQADGKLLYQRSGREPVIYIFSRTGNIFSCRPSTTFDLAAGYEPIFCKESSLPRSNRLDFNKDVSPLIVAEMWAAHSMRRAHLLGGTSAERMQRAKFEAASPKSAITLGKSLLGPGDIFDPETLIMGENGFEFQSPYQARATVIKRLEYDVSESLKGEYFSPYKHGIEVLRALRNFMRYCVSHQKLTPESRCNFFSQIAPRISSLIVGPPVSRGREWLALIEAGVLHIDLGPSPALWRDPIDGFWVARSSHLMTSKTVQFDRLVQGFVSHAPIDVTKSPLLANMAKSGLCALLEMSDHKSLRVNRSGQAVDSTGQTVPGLTILGVPTEGSTYFNHYLPSPNSRAQVFEQINLALDALFTSAQSNA
ncbi:MAG: FAD/NAD(P)-binding protein [Gammaproteobacteria bacterium]|nr:FAD/NAD(P)-binding protein [Gammaproteobacteria bacterium]